MKKLLPGLLATLLLTTATEAQATCSFICEGSLIDGACSPLMPAPGEDAAVWTDASRAPLLAVSCQVQCCAPGMCSDPTPETIMAETLQLLDVKGMDRMGSFQEERSPLCMGKQVFSVTSSLTQNEVYDVVHQGLILARFEYAPMAIEQDMGQGDMDTADMGSGGEDMHTMEDMPVDSVDMALPGEDMNSGAEEMGASPDPIAGDMSTPSQDMSPPTPDQGEDDDGDGEQGGCQTASTGSPSGTTPLGLLGLGLLVGVRRLRRGRTRG